VAKFASIKPVTSSAFIWGKPAYCFNRLDIARYFNRRLLIIAAIAFIVLVYGLQIFHLGSVPVTSILHLLTDPFLQLPTENSVRVVWFTEFEGSRHMVEYGEPAQTAIATTTKLSRVREDQDSRVGEQPATKQIYQTPTWRSIWRHEAEVTGLVANQPAPYHVVSVGDDGQMAKSDRFTLVPLPTAGTPLKILLTSDHQLKPMTPANLQKVVETVGQVDAIFMAGDLVNVPDRASEWFDDNRGGAFFPSLQGRAWFQLNRGGTNQRYSGGALIQSAPLFPALGNHEVMGRFSMNTSLDSQFNDPFPRQAAEKLQAHTAQPTALNRDPQIQAFWLKDNTYNTDTYEEIFSLPSSSPGGKTYYAITFGDVRLIVLYITNVWRIPGLDATARGRYRERDDALNELMKWGYGQHISEPITPGSPQYEWLNTELDRSEFRQAKYKLVMFHHPPHCLGDNIVPAYTDPVQIIDYAVDGRVKAVRYEYPLQQDHIIQHVVPLLEAAGVQLVFYGHSHIWNRFISSSGMHFLETSNVGNTYGAYIGSKRRAIPIGYDETYAATNDPNGLEPVMPTIAPLLDETGQPQPYLASDDITAFSILDTDAGTISSYRFDTRTPDSAVIKFDEFKLSQ
jgi:hypothetical protein